MEYIDIAVVGKRATTVDPKVAAVCGNNDYSVRFLFDEEWSEYGVKTARFITTRGYFDQLFEGDICPMPMLSNVSWVEVGVYAGNLSTTTRAYLRMERSILCGDPEMHPEPPEDVYNQLMEKVNEIPSPTNDDNGLVLGVIGGRYTLMEQTGGGGSGGGEVLIDNTTIIRKNGVLTVNTADEPEQDNTLPITSAAVHTTVGNIEVLLSTI